MESRLSRPAEPDRLSPTERLDLERFRAGDEDAFAALMRPQLGALRALARRASGDEHWADDLLQETLVRAYRGLSGFRGEAALRSWLFRILLRLLAEPRRWKHSDSATGLEGVEIPDVLGLSPDEGIRERELRERLQEALERLSPRQRSAFHLRAVEGMDYRAIAEVMACSSAAARMLVLAARRKVMVRMGRHLRP
ncbi:MAG: RNA polymerase sigma factor [Planctomycetota bacterium]|jgi:RNA polymerase sigma-70 factor (ECF subfamily)